jgi:SAM-dependent MidA family methyltransferase
MTFAEFMGLALYHSTVGYYRQPKARVGYGAGTDFFTASTSGTLFGELLTAAIVRLLADNKPSDFTFLEIGAEPKSSVLQNVIHPFKTVQSVRVGDPFTASGRCIVFSNELFDAQPFRRFVFRSGKWLEVGVTLRGDKLAMVELPTSPPAVLPPRAPEGYIIDAPLAATALAGVIASQPWTGLFLACDYGKSWAELSQQCPEGTARAYFRHTQSNDLLARPGEQDLTCHVCWDWLGDALARGGFTMPQLETQEAFFIHHAAHAIATISAADAAHFSPRKLSLLQLLHPSHLGQKFQALHAWRG